MAADQIAVAEERLLPIAPMGAGAQELVLDDPAIAHVQPVAQAFDAGDAALALGSLEYDSAIVLAGGRRFERLPARDPRPLAEQIDVARVVHLIDDARASRAATDLAEDRFAFGRVEPLHMRES